MPVNQGNIARTMGKKTGRPILRTKCKIVTPVLVCADSAAKSAATAGVDLQLECCHIAVETELRETSPQQLVALEGTHVLVNLLEFGRLGFVFCKHFHRSFEACIHEFFGECLEFDLRCDQPLQG